jgi:hypothetical protein
MRVCVCADALMRSAAKLACACGLRFSLQIFPSLAALLFIQRPAVSQRGGVLVRHRLCAVPCATDLCLCLRLRPPLSFVMLVFLYIFVCAWLVRLRLLSVCFVCDHNINIFIFIYVSTCVRARVRVLRTSHLPIQCHVQLMCVQCGRCPSSAARYATA